MLRWCAPPHNCCRPSFSSIVGVSSVGASQHVAANPMFGHTLVEPVQVLPMLLPSVVSVDATAAPTEPERLSGVQVRPRPRALL
jgi:hypothetical protein